MRLRNFWLPVKGLLLKAVRRAHHSLHKSDWLYRYNNGWLWLECSKCGYETNGWMYGKNIDYVGENNSTRRIAS